MAVRLFGGLGNHTKQALRIDKKLRTELGKFFRKNKQYDIRDLELVALHTVWHSAAIEKISRGLRKKKK